MDDFQVDVLVVGAGNAAACAALAARETGASVAMLVPDSHRDRANAISQMMNPAANAIAPTSGSIALPRGVTRTPAASGGAATTSTTSAEPGLSGQAGGQASPGSRAPYKRKRRDAADSR